MSKRLLLATAIALLALSSETSAQRIKDFARVEGIRPQPLTGLGLVVGLAGTGDNPRSQTLQTLYAAALANQGFEFPEGSLRSKNIAVVMVTANVSSWTSLGSEIEVTVSSAGDAKSLRNGQLLQTLLYGPKRDAEDDPTARPIALAQGALQIVGEAETVGKTKATLEGDVSFPMHHSNREKFRILLHRPDFSTASYVARAVNESPLIKFLAKEEMPIAHAEDLGSIVVKIPPRFRDEKRIVDFVSKIMTDVPVDNLNPDARVVIDRKSGGVSINGNVRVRPVVVLFGGMEISIGKAPAGSGESTNPGRTLLLIDVVGQLEQAGLDPKDLPEVIRLIYESSALIGELVER